MKIDLEIRPLSRHRATIEYLESIEGRRSMPLKASLPFFRSNQGILIHRIRCGFVHYIDFKPSHTSLLFWCGNGGFMAKGVMMDTAPDRAVFCATCEGRAVGAGLCGVREIAGRKVLYRPRI